MRLLVVHPGSGWATADVHTGLVAALRQAGHAVWEYALDARIVESGHWLRSVWRRHVRRGGPFADTEPSGADVQYHASTGVLERALRHEVDWVVVVTGMYLHPDAVVLLKRAGLPLALWFTESPYDDQFQAKVAALADACFTNERTSVPLLRLVNPETHYLPVGYDPARHRPDAADVADVPAHDVVFVGTGFQERVDVLAAADWSGIDFGLYGTWGLLGSRHRLRKYLRGGVVPNARTTALYRRAKIGLNLYRTSVGFGRRVPRVAAAESLNPRAYELAACGVFTISSARAEVEETFGGLVPTFAHPRLLEPLVRRWLADAPGRERAAAQLPDRVAGATYAARAAALTSRLEAVASARGWVVNAA